MRKCQWIQFCSMKNPINQCSNKTNKNSRGMIGNNRNCSKEFTSLESMSNSYSFPTFKINTDASVYHLFGRTGFSFAFLQWLQLCISNIANMRIKSVRIEFHCASVRRTYFNIRLRDISLSWAYSRTKSKKMLAKVAVWWEVWTVLNCAALVVLS